MNPYELEVMNAAREWRKADAEYSVAMAHILYHGFVENDLHEKQQAITRAESRLRAAVVDYERGGYA